MRIARLCLLLVPLAIGTEATAATNDLPSSTLVGSWKCATVRDHMKLRVTFLANGTVVGHTQDKNLAGRYVREGDGLSITGSDQVIMASSLQVADRVASANLLNGDQISCRRLK